MYVSTKTRAGCWYHPVGWNTVHYVRMCCEMAGWMYVMVSYLWAPWPLPLYPWSSGGGSWRRGLTQLANFSIRIEAYVIHTKNGNEPPLLAFPENIYSFLQLSYGFSFR